MKIEVKVNPALYPDVTEHAEVQKSGSVDKEKENE